ncbi:MAG: AAA family ATPase [Dehalococcoidia bacterium]
MELYVGVIGIVGVVFVVIFGGRGLIDLVRGYSERRRTRLAAADDSPAAEQPVGAIAATTIAQESLEPTEPTPAVPLVELDPVYRRTFVGRDAELKQLHDAFDEALAGHGSLAMVVGEPGIGKTSLCEQLAAYVAERGGKTLVGHCYEEGSLSLPYLAFVEAVRSHVLVLEPEDLKAQLGHGADELARVVPEIRERMQIELGAPGDPEEERYRLLQAASDFLRNAAASKPLLVVLEDLHDADRGTLDMLTHLARNLSGSRLLVVGTYRDVQVDRAHPLASALAELRRVTSFERIRLRGLTQDEVHRMLQAIAGHEVPWRWAEVVHQQTEGNPLFVQEVMRYLVEEGLLARQEGELRRVGDEPLVSKIPEGLRDVIGKRLTRLSPECNRALSLAAVVGREFRLDVLLPVAEVADEALYTALEEASAVGIIEERPAARAGERFRFTHAFFRQTLYEEIFAPRRLRLHQQVAQALEMVHKDRLEEHASEIAEHLAQSNDPGILAKALTFSEMAASRSMAVFAYGEAARLFEQSIKIQEELDPSDRAKRCDLLLALADALMPAGEPDRVSGEVAPEALAIAEAIEDDVRASRACRLAIEALHRSGAVNIWRSPEWRQWAERADWHAAPDTVDRVYADLAMARVRDSEGRGSDRLVLYQRALDLARGLDDPEALFSVVWLIIRVASEDEQERLAKEFASRPTDRVRARTLSLVREFTGNVFIQRGDRATAEELWRSVDELANRTQDTFPMVLSLSFKVWPATLDGRLEDAIAAGEELVARSEELGLGELGKGFADSRTLETLRYLGRFEQALEAMGRTRQVPQAQALFLAGLGRLSEAQDSFDRSMADIDDLAPSPRQLRYLLDTAVLLNDREAADRLARLLAPFSDHSTADVTGGTPARALGGASALLGKPDEARAYYHQALEAAGKISIRPEIALIRLGLAELLLDSFPAERDEAVEHLEFAIAEFREMKMQPSLERALARQQGVKN